MHHNHVFGQTFQPDVVARGACKDREIDLVVVAYIDTWIESVRISLLRSSVCVPGINVKSYMICTRLTVHVFETLTEIFLQNVSGELQRCQFGVLQFRCNTYLLRIALFKV